FRLPAISTPPQELHQLSKRTLPIRSRLIPNFHFHSRHWSASMLWRKKTGYNGTKACKITNTILSQKNRFCAGQSHPTDTPFGPSGFVPPPVFRPVRETFARF